MNRLIVVFVIVVNAAALQAQTPLTFGHREPLNDAILQSGGKLYTQRPQVVFPPARPAAAAVNDQLLQALYLSEFQRQVAMNDESLVGRFRPILAQWLQQRRNVAARRNAALTSLRQLLAGKANDEQITRQIDELDVAENQTRNSERRLFNMVDPLLTPAQQGRFRLFQIDMEQRIRELLVESARPAANPQPQLRGSRAPQR